MRIAESVSHRIFERTLRPLVFRRACLFERHFTTQAWLGIGRRGTPARLKVFFFRLSDPSLSVVATIRGEIGGRRPLNHFIQVDLGSGRDTR